MNLNSVIPVRIQTSLNSSHILAYNLEPTDGTLNSPLVNNNGKPLLLDGHSLPAILPRWTDQIELKPLTFGFFVMVDANATACLWEKLVLISKFYSKCDFTVIYFSPAFQFCFTCVLMIFYDCIIYTNSADTFFCNGRCKRNGLSLRKLVLI